jgi:ribonucleoside-diphosphate reductase beta chain
MSKIFNQSDEPILNIDYTTRRIFLPIPAQWQEFWDMYEQHRDLDWRVGEIDLNPDIRDWKKLTPDEQYFILHVLAFFSASDGIVNESVTFRIYNEVGSAEIRAFYAFQSHIETIHAHMYSQLIDVYMKDYPEKERDDIFDAIEVYESIGKKGKFALEIIHNDSFNFVHRIVYQLIIEGIFFSASFCAIYWLKKSGLMPGLCQSNELIARDEGMHCEFGVAVYKSLKHKLSEKEVQEMFKTAVDIEIDYVNEALPVKLIGMDSEKMIQYVKFVADHWLTTLGYSKLYNEKNPFDWMELISMEGKTNFFEKRVTEYTRPGNSEKSFEISEDF